MFCFWLFTAIAINVHEESWYYFKLSEGQADIVLTSYKSISQKINVIKLTEFDPAYFDVTVKHANNHRT